MRQKALAAGLPGLHPDRAGELTALRQTL